nr:DUF4112 domain-containing protein [Haladaptatus sp. W1]
MSRNSDLKDEFDFEGELPPTLDRAAIDRMRTVARVFDDFMRVPGTDFRVGLDPILGALPGSATSSVLGCPCTSSSKRPAWASRSPLSCG